MRNDHSAILVSKVTTKAGLGFKIDLEDPPQLSQ